MSHQLTEQTEGLDIGSLLKQHNLERLLSQLRGQYLTIDILKHASEGDLREICKAFELDIFTQLKFIAAIKSIPNAAAASTKEIVFLGKEEKEILDVLNDKHKKVSKDIHQIQNAINSLERSAVETNKLVHIKCDELICKVEKSRKSLLNQITKMKSRRKDELELQLKALQSVNKATGESIAFCRQIILESGASTSDRVKKMTKQLREQEIQELSIECMELNNIELTVKCIDRMVKPDGIKDTFNIEFTAKKISLSYKGETRYNYWDPNCIGNSMLYDIKKQIITLGSKPGSSTFMKNVIESGCHKYKFKIRKRPHDSMLIGLWRMNSKSKSYVNPPTHEFFLRQKGNGYGFGLYQGKLIKSNGCYGKRYGTKCRAGDIVEMIVDFESLTLRYVINGKDYGKAYDITKDRYRVAIYICYVGDSIQLL